MPALTDFGRVEFPDSVMKYCTVQIVTIEVMFAAA